MEWKSTDYTTHELLIMEGTYHDLNTLTLKMRYQNTRLYKEIEANTRKLLFAPDDSSYWSSLQTLRTLAGIVKTIRPALRERAYRNFIRVRNLRDEVMQTYIKVRTKTKADEIAIQGHAKYISFIEDIIIMLEPEPEPEPALPSPTVQGVQSSPTDAVTLETGHMTLNSSQPTSSSAGSPSISSSRSLAITSTSNRCEAVLMSTLATDDDADWDLDTEILFEDMEECRHKISDIWIKARQDTALVGVADFGKSLPII